jgi:hypothetical protein
MLRAGDVAIAAQLEAWPVPKFPVNGKLLKDAGMWGLFIGLLGVCALCRL